MPCGQLITEDGVPKAMVPDIPIEDQGDKEMWRAMLDVVGEPRNFKVTSDTTVWPRTCVCNGNLCQQCHNYVEYKVKFICEPRAVLRPEFDNMRALILAGNKEAPHLLGDRMCATYKASAKTAYNQLTKACVFTVDSWLGTNMWDSVPVRDFTENVENWISIKVTQLGNAGGPGNVFLFTKYRLEFSVAVFEDGRRYCSKIIPRFMEDGGEALECETTMLARNVFRSMGPFLVTRGSDLVLSFMHPTHRALICRDHDGCVTVPTEFLQKYMGLMGLASIIPYTPDIDFLVETKRAIMKYADY